MEHENNARRRALLAAAGAALSATLPGIARSQARPDSEGAYSHASKELVMNSSTNNSVPADSALAALSSFATRVTLERAPSEVIERTKLQLLDAFASVFAPAQTLPGRIVARSLDSIEAGGPSRVLATGASASVNTAAFINTQMSTAQDVGTNLFYSQGLGGLATFGALALAEASGQSGKSLLQAVLTGFEVAGRFGLSFSQNRRVENGRAIGDLSSSTGTRWVALGAAAANAKIRSLNASQTAQAFALMVASIPVSPRWDWGDHVPMAKYGLFGNMATSAVTSTLMAEAGFTGDVRILDAEDGIHNALSKDPRAASARDVSAMIRDYGDRWLIMDSGLKRYPSGTHNQQALHTVDRMVREHGIDPTRIKSIQVRRAIGTKGAFANQKPGNDVAVQFSLPFQVAALALGIPHREWHNQLGNERLLALAGKVVLIEDPVAIAELAATPIDKQRSPWSLRSHVRIEGPQATFERWSDYGSMTMKEVEAKFRHYAEPILNSSGIDRIVETIGKLELVADIRELTALFPAQSSPRKP